MERLETNSDLPVLVIIAALNEEKGIGPTLADLREVCGDPILLVVDGNSTDRTVEIALEMKAHVTFQKGSGKGDAIAQAVRHVDFSIEYVVFIDADFTYPAEYIPNMIRILEENPGVGMVIGNRFNHKHELTSVTNPFFIGNRLLALAQRLLNGVDLRDPLSGLRVVRWQILRNWRPKSRGFDIEAEINHLVKRQRYRTVEIPIYYRKRLGEKKLRLRDGFTILKRIVSESLSKAQKDRND